MIALDGDVAADVADAERAITTLNIDASALVDTEALARLLLRAESVASSRSRVSSSAADVYFAPKQLASWARTAETSLPTRSSATSTPWSGPSSQLWPPRK